MAKTIHHKSGVSTHLQATLASEKDQKSSQTVPHVPLYLTSTRPMCSPYVPLTNRIPSISVPFLNRLGNWPAEERKLIQVIITLTTFCPNAFREPTSNSIGGFKEGRCRVLYNWQCPFVPNSGASGTFPVGVVCLIKRNAGRKWPRFQSLPLLHVVTQARPFPRSADRFQYAAYWKRSALRGKGRGSLSSPNSMRWHHNL